MIAGGLPAWRGCSRRRLADGAAWHAAEAYASSLGLAFQIRDDMLDVMRRRGGVWKAHRLRRGRGEGHLCGPAGAGGLRAGRCCAYTEQREGRGGADLTADGLPRPPWRTPWRSGTSEQDQGRPRAGSSFACVHPRQTRPCRQQKIYSSDIRNMLYIYERCAILTADERTRGITAHLPSGTCRPLPAAALPRRRSTAACSCELNEEKEACCKFNFLSEQFR